MSLDGSSGQEAAVSQQQWEDFLSAFQDRLKLLRLIANVSIPCFFEVKLRCNGYCTPPQHGCARHFDNGMPEEVPGSRSMRHAV
jgi:hypothetical protein